MSRRQAVTTFMLLHVLLIAGCDSGAITTSEIFAPPKGITVTTEEGEVLAYDPDDWQVLPPYVELIQIQPARPNPAIGKDVVIPVLLHNPTYASLSAWIIYDGRLVIVDDLPPPLLPGPYALKIPSRQVLNMASADSALFRCLIYLGSEIVSYGDVSLVSDAKEN